MPWAAVLLHIYSFVLLCNAVGECIHVLSSLYSNISSVMRHLCLSCSGRENYDTDGPIRYEYGSTLGTHLYTFGPRRNEIPRPCVMRTSGRDKENVCRDYEVEWIHDTRYRWWGARSDAAMLGGDASGGRAGRRTDLLCANEVASIRVGRVKGVESNETHLVL